MSLNIPTTKQVKDQNIAVYENELGQDAPIQDKAFIRVKAGVEAMNFTQLYKYAAERSRQNLVLTATGEDLEKLGRQESVDKRLGQPCIVTAEITGVNGTIISLNRSFVAEVNGIIYTLAASSTIVGGVATLTLTASESGVTGNLIIGNTLTIDQPVPGANSIATVTAVSQLGTEEEQEETYRQRILDKIRASGGGGNSSDYRLWSQEVEGVARAYPFSGKPAALLAESSPPDRTVYIEADLTIDPDGIAPGVLLDAVRDNITTDPITGLARQPLGLTDETLYIESITRTGFYVTVRGLVTPVTLEAQVQAAIEDSLEIFFRALRTFVDGLDPSFDRNDLITDLIVSDAVQDVLKANGSSAKSVGFGLVAGVFLSSYQLAPGELAKLIQVDFEP